MGVSAAEVADFAYWAEPVIHAIGDIASEWRTICSEAEGRSASTLSEGGRAAPQPAAIRSNRRYRDSPANSKSDVSPNAPRAGSGTLNATESNVTLPE